MDFRGENSVYTHFSVGEISVYTYFSGGKTEYILIFPGRKMSMGEKWVCNTESTISSDQYNWSKRTTNCTHRYEDIIITILLRFSKFISSFFSGQVFFINNSFLIAKYSEDNLKMTFIFYLSFKEYWQFSFKIREYTWQNIILSRHVAIYWQILSHVVSSTPRHERDSNSQH